MSKTERVVLQETPRDNYTQNPNVIYDLLEQGLISHFAFILYSIYRKIAGENGACWVGTRGLSKKCGLCAKSITKAKKELQQNFACLGGKSLIILTPGDRKKEEADLVTIEDIWKENHDHHEIKKMSTCGINATPLWHKCHDPVVNMPHKNNIYQDPCIKKDNVTTPCGNVHNSTPPNKEHEPKKTMGKTMPSSIDKKRTLDASRRWKLTDDQRDTFNFLDSSDIDTDEGTKAFWAKNYSLERIIEVFEEARAAKGVRSIAAYMQKLLKSNANVSKGHAEANREFAEGLKKSTGWYDLKILKKYVSFPNGAGSNETIDYNTPQDVFAQRIMEKEIRFNYLKQ